MLSDSQIERYARQVILPEVGGRGQERLLAASVAVDGRGDAARLCATHLASAGIGRLWCEAAPMLTARNPDCVRPAVRPSSPDLTILIAADGLDAIGGGPLLWGGSRESTLACAYMPRDESCGSCLATHVRSRGLLESTAELGHVLALVALRALLGLGREPGPWTWQLDGDHPDAAVTAFPRHAHPACTLTPS